MSLLLSKVKQGIIWTVTVSLLTSWTVFLPQNALAQEYPGKSQLEIWFKAADLDDRQLDITFSNESPRNPPKISLPVNSSIGRPAITLQLFNVSGEGSFSGVTFVRNTEWYTFIGFETESGKRLDNFYFLLNDNSEEYFYYDPEGDEGGVVKGKFGETIGDPEVPTSETASLMALTMNWGGAPNDIYENCVQASNEGKEVRLTGPIRDGIEPRPSQETLQGIPGFTDSQIKELNQNCLNTTDNGWLAYWGVSRQSAFSNQSDREGCSLNWIIEGGILGSITGLGAANDPPAILESLGISDDDLNIITRLSLCLYIWTVLPFSTWVGGVIADVGGIAALPGKPAERTATGKNG